MSAPIVTVNEGRLQGKLGKTITGKTTFCYEGIPYAQPPVGDLRFKAPKPALAWEGVKDATKKGPQNYGLDLDMSVFKNLVTGKYSNEELSKMSFGCAGDEDCLTLNVYTPETPNLKTKPKPVMVWVHGGGYTVGSTHQYGPEFLLNEDVVLVTIHYRLGALGFVAFDDISLDVPGNAGMKDMILALKWVQNNIKNFNGDPNNVTVFGQSAGGSAVHYLMLSPLSKGLLHRVIVQSGSALNCWARGNTNNGKELAKILGCTATDDKDILKFLQELPVDKLFQGQQALKDVFDASSLRYFAPTIEKPSPNAFLAQDPIEAINSGNFNHVPLMTGVTSMEGIPFVKSFDLEIMQTRVLDDATIPSHLGYKKGSEEHQRVSEKIIKFYFGDKEPNLSCVEAAKIATDLFFNIEMIAHALAHAKKLSQPVYFYVFSADTPISILPAIYGYSGHGNDLSYLYKFHDDSIVIKEGSLEDLTIRRMVKLWTNFAKTGNPNSEKPDDIISTKWSPITSDKVSHLDIGENLVAKDDYERERVDFWRKIYKESPSGKIFFE